MKKHPAILHYQELKRAKLRSETTCSDDEFERYFAMLAKYKRPSKASQLETIIVDYVTLLGHQASKITTSGTFVDNTKVVKDVLGHSRTVGSKKYIPGNSTKGVADIICTIYGLKADVEIKFSKGDKQRDTQKEYQTRVEKAGGTYVIIKSFESFYEWLNDFLELPQVKMMKEYYELNK